MSLTVEDGSGMADAESYLSVADFKSRLEALGRVYTDYDDTRLEQALRIGTNYVDSKWRYKGARLTAAQALEYPRKGLVDWSSYAVTGVPLRVKHALADLAWASLTGNLFENLDRGGMVKSESVGPISVSYMDGAPAGKVFESAKHFLLPYLRDPTQSAAPFNGSTENAYFELGQMDNLSQAADSSQDGE